MADGHTGMSLHERIDHDLTNHPPTHPSAVERFEFIRSEAKKLGHVLVDACPPSRELSLAITAVEQAVMYAVAAIARNQDRLPE